MRQTVLVGALACASIIGLMGQSSYDIWHQPDGSGIVGQIIYCSTGKPREAAPCGTMTDPMHSITSPLKVLTPDPILLRDLSETPKTFALTQPPGTTTYRLVNRCFVDVRLRASQTATESVGPETGIVFLARTETTMGTNKPPFVSAMTMGAPTGTCTPELHYGVGGG